MLSCALVWQKLARAAAAATQSQDTPCSHYRPERYNLALNWINSHGSSLTRLIIGSDTSDSPICQLPCPNLLELQLACSLQLCAGSRELVLLHSCTKLTRLELFGPTIFEEEVVWPAGGMPAAVAQLKNLVVRMHMPEDPTLRVLDVRSDQALTDGLGCQYTSAP